MSIFDQVGHDITHAGKSVSHNVSHAGGQLQHAIEGGVMQIKHVTTDSVNQVKHEAENGIHKIKGEVPDIEKYVKEGLLTALEELEKALAEPLLKSILHLLEAATPDTIWLSIGPATFTIDKVESKIDTIRHYVENPPEDASDIRKLLKDLEPADVEIALKVNVPGVQSLTIGATLVYLRDNFQEKLDEVWDAIKV